MHINDLKCFSYLGIQKEYENISHCELEVYINHLDNLRDDFKIRLRDLDNIHDPE